MNASPSPNVVNETADSPSSQRPQEVEVTPLVGDARVDLAESGQESNSASEVASPRAILIQTLVALLILGAALALISHFLRGPVEVWSKSFISYTGAWGVGLGFFFPDAFTLPIPPDAFLLAGHAGQLPFWEIVWSASLGSILGGTAGFLMIRTIADRPQAKRWIQKKLRSGQLIMDRYGRLALALGALTPLPYSVICWACGATGMKFRPFILISLLRIPRVIGYLFVIQMTY